MASSTRVRPTVFPVNDAALIARVRSGDPAAFEAIFRRSYDGLFAWAWRHVRNRELAEEIVQDVLLAVWDGRADWAPRDIDTYFYGAVRNRALSALKRGEVATRYMDREMARGKIGMIAAPAADMSLAAAELDAAIRGAVATLPDRCRLTFLLNREHGQSYAEIATILGVSVKTVETQMGRALGVLRRALKDWLA